MRDERKIGDDEGWESLSLSSFYQENRVLGSRAAGGVLHSLSFLYSGILVRKTLSDAFYSCLVEGKELGSDTDKFY